MKALLKLLNIHVTLGENLFTTKTLTKWLSELSQKFPFLLSYWQPAYSYGQTQTQALHQPMDLLKATASHAADQEQVISQSAFTKKKQQTSSNSDKHWSSISFSKTLDFSLEKFKIRVLNGLYTFWENKRLRWGMLTLLIIAPLTKFLYLLFPVNGFGEYLINVGPITVINTIEGEANGWFWGYIYQYVF